MGIQRYGRQQFRGLRDSRLTSGDACRRSGDHVHRFGAACEALGLLVVEGVDRSRLREPELDRVAIMFGVSWYSGYLHPDSDRDAGLRPGMPHGDQRLSPPRRSGARCRMPRRSLLGRHHLLGAAMEQTGLAEPAVNGLLSVARWRTASCFRPFFAFTGIMTESLSNNAVAVLLTSIARASPLRQASTHTPC